jgi:hypothetical protein
VCVVDEFYEIRRVGLGCLAVSGCGPSEAEDHDEEEDSEVSRHGKKERGSFKQR